MAVFYCCGCHRDICEEILRVKQTVLHFLKLFLILPQYLLMGIFLASTVPLGIDQIVGARLPAVLYYYY